MLRRSESRKLQLRLRLAKTVKRRENVCKKTNSLAQTAVAVAGETMTATVVMQ